MNIFQVLNQGKSRLHEPSISAVIGYLLDSGKDHGLGDVFIRDFLELIDADHFKEILKKPFIHSYVSLEEPYSLNDSRKDIDIQIDILDERHIQKHTVIIENKIRASAANINQLNDYYHAILSERDPNDDLYIIFLTPNTKNSLLIQEYSKLNILSNLHNKKWIYWSSHEESITSIIKLILQKELIGNISPINEYMRHTLKAFLRHISIITEPKTNQSSRRGEDLGDIVDEISITNSNGEYRLVMRDSFQIQAFNTENGDKEVARRIMCQHILEHKLPIHTESVNTRTIGKRLFDYYLIKKDK